MFVQNLVKNFVSPLFTKFFVSTKHYDTTYSFPLQPRPTKGKMRIHCLENVDKALSFLYDQRVQLENLGAHDIVDGTPRLTLGLIWTIILRFQIIVSAQLRPYFNNYYLHNSIVCHRLKALKIQINHCLRPRVPRMPCCSGAR